MLRSSILLFPFPSICCKISVMDLNFENDNLDECYVGIRAPKVVTKMSNKCNQCEYASSLAGNLKTHLKTHTGEKSNKCNQCDFASSYG